MSRTFRNGDVEESDRRLEDVDPWFVEEVRRTESEESARTVPEFELSASSHVVTRTFNVLTISAVRREMASLLGWIVEERAFSEEAVIAIAETLRPRIGRQHPDTIVRKYVRDVLAELQAEPRS